MKKSKTTRMYAVMVENRSTPSQLHTTYESAEAEAKRLSIKERQTAYVLLAVSKVEINDVKITSLE